MDCIVCIRDGESTEAVKLVTEQVKLDLVGETHHASASGPICQDHLEEVNARVTADPDRSATVEDLPDGGGD